MIIPTLPKIIAGLTGYKIGKASIIGGWLVFIYAFMQFCFAPFLGHLSDVFGRKRILQISLFALCIDYILHGFASNIYFLFAGRMIAGLLGGNYATATAYFADTSNPTKRSQNFALVGSAFGLGFILGPLCGSYALTWGDRVPFYLSAVCSLLGFLLITLFLKESLPASKRAGFDVAKANPLGVFAFIQQHPHLQGLLLGISLIYVVTYAILSNWPYYTIYMFGWHEIQIGYSLALTGVFIIISQGIVLRLLLRFLSTKHVIYLSLITYLIAVMMFAINQSEQFVLWNLLLFSLGGMVIPAIQGALSTNILPHKQGELQGAITALLSAGTIIGPVIINYVFSFFTSDALLHKVSGAGFALCALVVSIALIATSLGLKKVK